MGDIQTVGVVGFGVMGAAIGLNAAESGYKVIFKELTDDLVSKMYQENIVKPLKKKMDKGKIDQRKINLILSKITGTSNNQDLSKCDLIIEAAIENLDIKIKIFDDLNKICSKNTIMATNTSTFLIEQVMSKVTNSSRTVGLHYFFPANVNRLVEVISHKNTSEETFERLIKFSKNNGKIPISVKDFPGFAINPLFISSYMVLNSFYDGGLYNAATLDYISKLALGVKFGIMWVQNGSGLATCYHAAASMNNYLANTDIGYPMVPIQLKKQSEKNTPWNLNDGEVSKNPDLIKKVKEQLLGSIFTIAIHLFEKKVVSQDDLELGVKTALAWPQGPFSMMNKIGTKETTRLVHLAVKNKNFNLPKTIC